MRSLPSWPKHLPKAPHPNTITLVGRISTYEFWGDTNIQTHPTEALKSWHYLTHTFYFALQCVTTDMKRPVRRVCSKVNDASSLDYGDAEMKKEWFRIRFGGRTGENCQRAWGKERMTARFLTRTISWRLVPFSETWKLRYRWERGGGGRAICLYYPSLWTVFPSLFT